MMLRPLAIVLSCTMLFTGLPVPVPAQTPEAAAPGVAAQLQQGRELLKQGDYDRAIEVLRGAVDASHQDPAMLREAYLLLAKTYVFLGNDFKFKPQGRMASSLNYKEAKSTIAEMLAVPELRHTLPEPVDEYPPEMHALFDEVRHEVFGAFRVIGLEPADAVVLLDADTLGTLPGETTLGEVDLPVGKHAVLVQKEGYEDLAEEITVSPGSILERSYTMKKRRGKTWYGAWIGGSVALIAGVAALVAAGSDQAGSSVQPLPGPPPPPP
jgi:hypothetical protein